MATSNTVAVGQRTRESLREHARTIATKLQKGIVAISSSHFAWADLHGLSQMVSLCGNLEQLNDVARRVIEWHPQPVPDDLVALQRCIVDTIDPVMALAASAMQAEDRPDRALVARALASVEALLALAEPSSASLASAPRPSAARTQPH
jgi:hypothetical protein